MDVLERLHARLVQALASRGGDKLAPFTIAELYQQLIPYRAVRGELKLLELAPYEHALLRLLAGERGYLTIAQQGVVEELRRELQQRNPILGIYRDYAEISVFLSDTSTGSDDAESFLGDQFVAPPLVPPASFSPPLPEAKPALITTADDPVPGKPSCTGCRQILPEVDGLRFCPSCGADQNAPACAGCGASVALGWSFCVLCGHPQRVASL
ncbi:hypothetical protein BH23GEM6_BH23GEM6_14400 [soil metagenome]